MLDGIQRIIHSSCTFNIPCVAKNISGMPDQPEPTSDDWEDPFSKWVYDNCTLAQLRNSLVAESFLFSFADCKRGCGVCQNLLVPEGMLMEIPILTVFGTDIRMFKVCSPMEDPSCNHFALQHAAGVMMIHVSTATQTFQAQPCRTTCRRTWPI